ncbi:MAG: monovalent cation/H(+) antiporter subunit G [Bacteroidales bacterium]|nr:monovalent cation/H(+) antiporter subunit G [Bacteroidales bacterium]
MKELIVPILLMLGSLFVLIASIGIVRFNNLFSRMHATTKATSFGILLILVGVSLFFGTLSVVIKSLLVIVFIYLTAPLAAHSIAKSFKEINGKK